jgi:hypothetical protein
MANYNMSHVNETIVNIQVMVPFWEFQVDHLDDNKLVELILEQGDKKDRKTNVKADMTEWNMSTHEPFQQIVSRVEDVIKEWYDTRAGMNVLTTLTACWGAVYRKGDCAVPHSHLPDSYSFVYYPKVEADCSPLMFKGYTYFPKTGYGVIFPSYLDHMVKTVESDSIRVVVAGNLGVTAHRDPLPALE